MINWENREKVRKKQRERYHKKCGAGTTYISWKSMRARCNNPNHVRYYRYGGRGIKICERWNSYKNFLKDMGERPTGHTIDRIDNNGGYEPSNCRWTTPTEQNRDQHKRKK